MSGAFGSSQWAYSSGAEAVTQQSLKFNDDESQYLSWTPAATGNRKTWTWSGWVKRGNIGLQNFLFSSGADSSNRLQVEIESSNTINIEAKSGGSTQAQLRTAQVFRDCSAWYHIVLSLDTTQASSNDRFNLYVNGQEVTAFSTANYPSQNADLEINKAIEHNLGKRTYSSNYFDGYLSDIHFIDGQALDASSFGQFTNGYWEKIDYAGSYGTNGFHLTFADDVVSEGFNTVTYSGNGLSSGQSISGLGLSPDFVWLKERTSTSAHILIDTVRGANITLETNNTNAEFTPSSVGLASFDADGFTIGSNNGAYNSGSDNYVAWAWDAGSGSPVSNTQGSITSTVKANPAYGFSITSYVGTGVDGDTVGHGLSSAPELAIIKGRTGVGYPWAVYGYPTNSAFPADGSVLYLNDTAGMTESTGSELSLGASTISFVDSGANINGSGQDYICYAFHSVAGYSYISTYSGTGANGHKITTGFSPAFIMLKRYDSGSVEDWLIYDNTRNPVNLSGNEYVLRPNTSGAEQAYGSIDFESDGFTLQTVGGALNASGGNYIVMAFADTREAAFWKDVSGQGNHWTPNNLDYRDSLVDSPANNFATLNPLNAYRSGNVYSEGNLRAVPTSPYNLAYATMAQSTGKWYWEIYVEHRVVTNNNTAIGLEEMPASSSYLTKAYWDFGATRNDGSIVASDGTYPSFATGDVISVAVDFDNGKLWFAHNGSWINSGDPSAGTNNPLSTTVGSTYSPAFFLYYTATIPKFIANFGQDSTFAGAKPMGAYTDDNSIGNFQYAPPAGYLALCTANLPTPTIIDGSEHFNTVLYTGTGATRSVTGFNHTPELLWTKARSNASDHALVDIVRGTNKLLLSNGSYAEFTQTIINSFDSDGFSTSSASSAINLNGYTYAGWGWKAGGTAVSNTDGSITSQVSANTAAGFSIVSYTGNASYGQTVGHGLGVAPEMVIIKNRSNVRNWRTYHSALGATKYINLDETAAAGTYGSFNDTAPTSTVFSTTNSGSADRATNFNGDNYIAYCFHSVEGFSKVGSYTGNGQSGDGAPFVYTGFRPAWIMIKNTSGVNSWCIYDVERDTYNVSDALLQAQDAAAEATYGGLDFTSNGFKIRSSVGALNGSGNTLIYLAFASSPLKFATAR